MAIWCRRLCSGNGRRRSQTCCPIRAIARPSRRQGRAPLPGEKFVCPGQARTLTRIAESKGDDFYHGELAAAIAAHARNTGGLIEESDLAGHKADWVEPIAMNYRDVTLHEIGPNGQGIGALIALGILDNFNIDPTDADGPLTQHLKIEAIKLAVADMAEYVGDPDTMRNVTAGHLLDPVYLHKRATLIDTDRAAPARAGSPMSGGTVYLTAADKNGMMVSFIQSNFKGFGSGVVVPNTGIALQNRAFGFSLKQGHPNQVGSRQTAVPHHHPGLRDEGRQAAYELWRDGRIDAGTRPSADRLPPRRSRTKSASRQRRAALARAGRQFDGVGRMEFSKGDHRRPASARAQGGGRAALR